MKFIILLSVLTLTSCLAPTNSTRSAGATDEYVEAGAVIFNDDGSVSGSFNNTSGSTITTTTNKTAEELDLENVKWASAGERTYQYYHQHIGSYNIYLSGLGQNTIYVQMESSDNNEQICFLPTHRLASGNKVVVGEPICDHFNDENQYRIYSLDVIKKAGFSNAEINGVMILRDTSSFYPAPYIVNRQYFALQAVGICFDMLERFNDPTFCQAFQSVGNYIQHPFN